MSHNINFIADARSAVSGHPGKFSFDTMLLFFVIRPKISACISSTGGNVLNIIRMKEEEK